jgi:hypothetical protein
MTSICSYSCDLCGKSFNRKDYLKVHQKSKTACLKSQGKFISEKMAFKCEFCSRELCSKRSLENHLEICKIKIKQELLALKDLKEKFKKIEEDVEELKNKPSIINNINNSQNINITINAYMTPEYVKKNLLENFTHKLLCTGLEKNLADLVVDLFLTGDGSPVYLCRDRARKRFYWLDENGKLIEDSNAKKLSALTLQGAEVVKKIYDEEMARIEGKIKECNGDYSRIIYFNKDMDKLKKDFENFLELPDKGVDFQNQLSKRLPKSLEEKKLFDEEKEKKKTLSEKKKKREAEKIMMAQRYKECEDEIIAEVKAAQEAYDATYRDEKEEDIDEEEIDEESSSDEIKFKPYPRNNRGWGVHEDTSLVLNSGAEVIGKLDEEGYFIDFLDEKDKENCKKFNFKMSENFT